MSSDLFVVEYVDKVKEIFEKNRNDKTQAKKIISHSLFLGKEYCLGIII